MPLEMIPPNTPKSLDNSNRHRPHRCYRHNHWSNGTNSDSMGAVLAVLPSDRQGPVTFCHYLDDFAEDPRVLEVDQDP